MKIIIIFLLVLVSLAVANEEVAEADKNETVNCSSPETWMATLDTVDVDNCNLNGSEFCLLEKGTEKGITIKFTPRADIETVHTKVYGIIAGLSIPYSLSKSDVCAESQTDQKCPLPAGQVVTYRTALPVKQSYPMIKVPIKWKLVDKDNKVIVCSLIHAKIVKNHH